jgi:RNA polymerase-associated protein RTF1
VKSTTKRASSDTKKDTVKKKVDVEDFGDDDRSSDEDETEFDRNNSERLIKDEADRKYLASLPEFDREAILAERFEKLKAEQDMKKAMREAK